MSRSKQRLLKRANIKKSNVKLYSPQIYAVERVEYYGYKVKRVAVQRVEQKYLDYSRDFDEEQQAGMLKKSAVKLSKEDFIESELSDPSNAPSVDDYLQDVRRINPEENRRILNETKEYSVRRHKTTTSVDERLQLFAQDDSNFENGVFLLKYEDSTGIPKEVRKAKGPGAYTQVTPIRKDDLMTKEGRERLFAGMSASEGAALMYELGFSHKDRDAQFSPPLLGQEDKE